MHRYSWAHIAFLCTDAIIAAQQSPRPLESPASNINPQRDDALVIGPAPMRDGSAPMGESFSLYRLSRRALAGRTPTVTSEHDDGEVPESDRGILPPLEIPTEGSAADHEGTTDLLDSYLQTLITAMSDEIPPVRQKTSIAVEVGEIAASEDRGGDIEGDTLRTLSTQEDTGMGIREETRRLQMTGGPFGGLLGRVGGGSGLPSILQSFVGKELETVSRKNGLKFDPQCDASEKGTCCFFSDLCDPIATCVAETNPQSIGDLAKLVPQCVCPEGFKGDGRKRGEQCTNIDECLEGIAYCEHQCVDMAPGYRCECREGYRLQPDARSCRDIDECKEGLHDCDDICINLKGGFECGCGPGYKPDPLNPHKCNDVDECLEAQFNGWELCHFMDMCHNTEGSYVCGCPSGTVSDPQNAHMCLDIDECAELDDPCPNSRISYEPSLTHMTQWCENVYGGYNCLCLPGLKETDVSTEKLRDLRPRETRLVDGREIHLRHDQSIIRASELLCADIDECREQQPLMCPGDDVLCINEYRTASCRCKETQMQWNTSTKRCHKDTVCRSNTCGNDPNALCKQHKDDFECACREGYKQTTNEDATIIGCEDINECVEVQNVCPFHSTCQNNIGGYKCLCDYGFTQDASGHCVDINECAAGACAGPCLNVDGAYSCGCPPGTMARGRDDAAQLRTWSVVNDRINSYGDEDSRLAAFQRETAHNRLLCERYDECTESEGLLCGAGSQCRGSEGNFSCFCPIGTEMRATRIKTVPLLEDTLTRQISLHIRTLPFDVISNLDPMTLLTAVASLEPPTSVWKINAIPWQASSRFHFHRKETRSLVFLDNPSRETLIALLLELISEAEITSCEVRDLPRNVPPARFTSTITAPTRSQTSRAPFPSPPAAGSTREDISILSKKRRPPTQGVIGGLLSQLTRLTKPQSPIRRTTERFEGPPDAISPSPSVSFTRENSHAPPKVTLVTGPPQYGLDGVNGLLSRLPTFLAGEDMGVALNMTNIDGGNAQETESIRRFLDERLHRAERSLSTANVHLRLLRLTEEQRLKSLKADRSASAGVEASLKEESAPTRRYVDERSRQTKAVRQEGTMKSVALEGRRKCRPSEPHGGGCDAPVDGGAAVDDRSQRVTEGVLLATILEHLGKAIPDLEIITGPLVKLSHQLQTENYVEGARSRPNLASAATTRPSSSESLEKMISATHPPPASVFPEGALRDPQTSLDVRGGWEMERRQIEGEEVAAIVNKVGGLLTRDSVAKVIGSLLASPTLTGEEGVESLGMSATSPQLIGGVHDLLSVLSALTTSILGDGGPMQSVMKGVLRTATGGGLAAPQPPPSFLLRGLGRSSVNATA